MLVEGGPVEVVQVVVANAVIHGLWATIQLFETVSKRGLGNAQPPIHPVQKIPELCNEGQVWFVIPIIYSFPQDVKRLPIVSSRRLVEI